MRLPGMQIKVLDKAIEIMELLGTSTERVRLKDVVEALNLNKTTALRILRVLESYNLVSRDEDSGFVIGSRVLWWETCYRRKFELLSVVRPYVEKLRDLTSETAIFSILANDRSVIVNQAVSPQVTSTRYDLGGSAPLHVGASGKAILAHLSSEKRSEFLRQVELERVTRRTVVDRSRLDTQLKEVRRKGFAVSNGERWQSTASVAVPVFKSSDEVAGAMAVIGPSQRLTFARCRKVAPILLEEARLLSKQLGGEGVSPLELVGMGARRKALTRRTG